MARRTLRSSERRIFFPWEARGGLGRWLRVGRVRSVVFVVALLALVLLIASRERRDSGLRQTRAALFTLRHAVDAYVADHQGACPAALSATLEYTSLESVPRDAWGRAFRFICPGRDQQAYELMSDGPDGEPEGLDRIK
ncbi:MAG: type II secretion system protein GspG [Polyangiaceae bacterium]|nr:type II secretion system protein GspG [Polyangiaceae bacterium]